MNTQSITRSHTLSTHDLPVDDLRDAMSGRVLTPADDGYDAARGLWNGMIDKRPAIIAQCIGSEDVIACIRFAREHKVPFAVRGGGHNVAGSASCDGGLVIDLTAMHHVDVDPDARRAYAKGGATIGHLDQATQPYGLAAPMGVVTETGIAGLTLGGGLGWIRRKHGLSCDALRSINIVTADGQLLHASADEHADLFWAVRGGGGNFGVVTRFEYELYDVGPEVFFLAVFYPQEVIHEVLGELNRFMEDAPDAFSPISVLGHLPPLPTVAADQHGAPMVAIVGAWIGDVAIGERALAPLRDLAQPLADLSRPMPYLEVQQFFDEDYPSGGRYYWKSLSLEALSPEVVDQLATLNDAAPSVESTIDLWFQGGAMSRVAADATAFGDRSAPVLFNIEANWHDEARDADNVAWVRRCFAAMQSFSDGGMYFNFPGIEGDAEQRLQTTYGANYARLQAIKRRYDPDNLFRTHQNIAPASATPAG